MIALVMVVLTQGPGSTLQPISPTAAPPTTLPQSTLGSDLQTRTLEGRPGSVIQLSPPTEAVRKVNLVEGGEQPCEGLAIISVCDDPTVIGAELRYTPLILSETIPPIVPHIRFTALKPGRTMCSCGQPKNLQLLYEFTVGSLEDAVRPVARKVVVAAYARLYTQPK
jgi:hypothetical protein